MLRPWTRRDVAYIYIATAFWPELKSIIMVYALGRIKQQFEFTVGIDMKITYRIHEELADIFSHDNNVKDG